MHVQRTCMYLHTNDNSVNFCKEAIHNISSYFYLSIIIAVINDDNKVKDHDLVYN